MPQEPTLPQPSAYSLATSMIVVTALNFFQEVLSEEQHIWLITLKLNNILIKEVNNSCQNCQFVKVI